MKKMKLSLIAATLLMVGFVSCDKNETNDPIPAVSKTDSITVSANTRTGSYTLYSFKDGKVIQNADSATAKWDFGVRLATIIVNSMAGGPGNVGVATVNGSFDNYTTAPESGYVQDSSISKRAIDSDVTTGWFDYDPVTHNFTPKAGKFFVFKTTDNKYVKMEIVSAAYLPFVGPMPEFIKYKFRYTYQPDGTRNF